MGTDRNNFYRNHYEFRGTKSWGGVVGRFICQLFIIFIGHYPGCQRLKLLVSNLWIKIEKPGNRIRYSKINAAHTTKIKSTIKAGGNQNNPLFSRKTFFSPINHRCSFSASCTRKNQLPAVITGKCQNNYDNNGLN